MTPENQEFDPLSPRNVSLADPIICVEIADPGNRRLLIEWLEERFEIWDGLEQIGTDHRKTDMLIVDMQGASRHWEEITDHQQTAEPRILPCLLVGSNADQSLPNNIQKIVHDRVLTPVTRRDLGWRIRTLLQVRNLSIRIDRKNDQLTEFAKQNERLEEFVNILAHDLRNPINVAKGYLDRLETTDTETVQTIATALERTEQITEDVLAVARGGKLVEEPEAVSFSPFVRTVWETVDTDQASLHIREDGTIICDAAKLRHLFENLFRNAVEHGGDDVYVGIFDEGFYVEDNGPGIPEAIRDDIFDIGFTHTEANTGIGLSIVKRIVEAHGWFITVTESEHGGARFEITGVGSD